MRQRTAEEGLSVIGLRFAGDPICQRARFDTLHRVFGETFEAIVLPDQAANPAAPKPPHSVLTLHLIDRDGEPTKEALRRVLAFLADTPRIPDPTVRCTFALYFSFRAQTPLFRRSPMPRSRQFPPCR